MLRIFLQSVCSTLPNGTESFVWRWHRERKACKCTTCIWHIAIGEACAAGKFRCLACQASRKYSIHWHSNNAYTIPRKAKRQLFTSEGTNSSRLRSQWWNPWYMYQVGTSPFRDEQRRHCNVSVVHVYFSHIFRTFYYWFPNYHVSAALDLIHGVWLVH